MQENNNPVVPIPKSPSLEDRVLSLEEGVFALQVKVELLERVLKLEFDQKAGKP